MGTVAQDKPHTQHAGLHHPCPCGRRLCRPPVRCCPCGARCCCPRPRSALPPWLPTLSTLPLLLPMPPTASSAKPLMKDCLLCWSNIYLSIYLMPLLSCQSINCWFVVCIS